MTNQPDKPAEDAALRERVKQLRSNNRSLTSILTSGAIDQIMQLFEADKQAAVEAAISQIPVLTKSERAELEDYRRQHVTALEDFHEFGKAPIGSPKRMAAYVSQLSMWNLKRGAEALEAWRQAAVAEARLDELYKAHDQVTSTDKIFSYLTSRILSLKQLHKGAD